MQAALASGGTSTANVHLALLSRAREIGLSGEVLDFGAGTGELTARLAASGLMLRLTAIDLLPPPAVKGQAVSVARGRPQWPGTTARGVV